MRWLIDAECVALLKETKRLASIAYWTYNDGTHVEIEHPEIFTEQSKAPISTIRRIDGSVVYQGYPEIENIEQALVDYTRRLEIAYQTNYWPNDPSIRSVDNRLHPVSYPTGDDPPYSAKA